MHRRILSEIPCFKALILRVNSDFCYTTGRALSLGVGEGDDPLYADVPKPPRTKSERKPYPTPMKILIRKAKEEREARKAQPCRILDEPPDNGVLIPELVDVAHQVYRARESLILGISKLIDVIPVQRCRYCFEVHIGHVGHEIRTCTAPKSGFHCATHVWRKGGVQNLVYFPKCFHLSDRVGKPRVGHDERRGVKRIPAIVELCIQAGLELDNFPTRRRTKPVYCIEGRIVDFEVESKTDEMSSNLDSADRTVPGELDSGKGGVPVSSNLENITNPEVQVDSGEGKSLRDISIVTLESWFEMISGAKTIMEKYKVHTCGYCPEVQVGPKGHKVRMCKASKHQSRNGLHAWQEATIDDLVGPNYVWHVRDLHGPALNNNLKRYYGKAPAVVELCVQAGAPVPDQYRSMMRIDVVPPDRDEVDLVA
ncbi:APO protein 3, mitochondrial [Cornus florida]|uniref:APO protein 3, mitochondrial n=1 Tax=Cornus florida TaxID=4283 RepID=UPI0028A1FB09|nr:APO protein 3, mitochondrial [Cornus florida]XP_059641699.1 APO protein 3, mitochondrial [Cornus florida]XP_059641700.1 APO protein 3, mitochondrial [Cornus florida]XP_059641701.1 APO protein 3, mitochondrial [Cornus florida]XP_059641702.1 APO protein 3, mitochondrial [Cornus florida]XP_059641703.1 APO protein 3, mitochondrial [Cornus florida]